MCSIDDLELSLKIISAANANLPVAVSRKNQLVPQRGIGLALYNGLLNDHDPEWPDRRYRPTCRHQNMLII